MAQETGRDVLLEVLRTEGVRHVFGNPGTTELPLIDALAAADDLSYVLCLQEATAVAAADGYAQVTGRPAFLNLHTSAGLGNAIGNLTNAQVLRTPLVVTAGQQHYGHIEADPMLSGDLVGLARPVSKWAHEVRTRRELGTILRRAFHDAAVPPAGPVFVSIPMSTLDEEGDAGAPPVSRIERGAAAGGVEELADLLTTPVVGRVALVLGAEVATAGAWDEAVALAEALGAPVHGAPMLPNAPFPPLHPLWAGHLVAAAAAMRAALSPYTHVLFLGAQPFVAYPYSEGSPLPDGVALLHVSSEGAQLGRTHAVRLGLQGDVRATLRALLPLVRARADAAAAADALEAGRARRAAEVEALEARARERYASSPMHPMAAAHALVRAVPADTPVVDEAITTGGYVRGFHHVTRPGRYFFCSGGGLGWGMPASVGVALGLGGNVPVLCVVGDGSAMYSPQALWTAARERLPIVFAVVNNRQYLILKQGMRGRKGESVRTGRFVGLDLDQPPVDYVGLARSMGVGATLVESAADVGDAVRQALAAGGPHLLELPIAAPE